MKRQFYFKNCNFKTVKFHIILISVFIFAFFAHGGNINIPHKYPRTSPNLLNNPSFNGTTGWTLTPIPQYDVSVSRAADGSGSIRIPANASDYAQIKSSIITGIELNTPYTISFYLKTQHEPVYVSACLHMYDAQNNRTFSYSTGLSATSTTGEWQEIVCIVIITNPAIVNAQVVIEKKVGPEYTADYYIDDVYFGKNISFEQPPVNSRQAFSGSKVTVDELGNWRVYENGAWRDFFPFGSYIGVLRDDFTFLSAQGFNLVMSQQFVSQVQMVKNAVSTFNPNGMRAAIPISNYATPNYYWNHIRLADTINSINNGGLSETLLFYDWDNENNWTMWSYWFDMVNTIRYNDTAHPIYVLNGSCGAQRLFSKRLSDVCGTYTGFDAAVYESGLGRIDVIQYLEKQDIPVSIAQINNVEEEVYGFRLRLYYALIIGAKGVVWWGDGRNDDGTTNPAKIVENRAWWSDIPNLRNEIDQLLPIIKQPHWTSWTATCSTDAIYYGTRDYQNEGYMILVNTEDTPITATFTLHGYSAGGVWDYFTGSFITSVTNNQFTVVLPGNSTAVYRLMQALVSHWKLDEASGTSATDSSGCANNATCVNNPIWVAGNMGNAVSLNAASSQYLTVADNATFNYANGVTISTWLKINSSVLGGIWSDIATSGKNGVIVNLEADGRIRFRVGDANGNDILSSPVATIQTGQWYHVACTYDNSTMKMYVNGVLIATSSSSRVITDNTQAKLIGKICWGPYYLDGCLDDLRIYRRALAMQEINELARIGWWKFDEKNGTSVADLSGCCNNATCVNNPTWAVGNMGNAVSLNAASSQYLTVTDNPTFNYANGVTISAWLKINSSVLGGIWSDIATSGKNGVIVNLEADGRIRFRVGDANGNDILSSPVATIQTGQWYHVACTYDNSTMKMYVNGVLIATSSSSRVITDNTQVKLIGKICWGPYYLDGCLDDLRIYRRALTASEVAELFQ